MNNDCKWEDEVTKALGSVCYDLLLDEVDANRISAKHTLDIARMLHKTVGGNFEKARDAHNFTYDRHALRNVISDWYLYAPKEVTLKKLTPESASTLPQRGQRETLQEVVLNIFAIHVRLQRMRKLLRQSVLGML